MRWVLAIAAFLLCAYEGRRRSMKLKNRAALLSEVLAMLNNFSIEIRCRSLTLDELLSGESGSFARLVLQKRADFGETGDIRSAWNAACEELPKSREKTLLSEFGQSFGKTDKSGQLRLLEMYAAQIGALKDEAESSYRQKGGALSKIGMLCGAAAAVLIL